jgi:hypothetical protein
MSQLQDEIDVNQVKFFRNWTAQAAKNWKALGANDIYKASYRRLCAVQAIKTELVVPHYKAGSAAFFFEAHNDTLVSHVNASIGAWRSALQALRSCEENVLAAIYYNDHPVELELWETGKFQISFSDLLKYAEKHPRLSKFGQQLTGVETIHTEYATLSKAVHASAANFRMTDAISNVLLWNVDPVKLSMWATRERRVIEGVSSLMVCLHSTLLQGTALTQLRNVLHFSISSNIRKRLKTVANVTIPERLS